MQLVCKNPFCGFDLRETEYADYEFVQGWCRRCYRLANRNGVSDDDKRVPLYNGKQKVSYQMFVDGAVKKRLTMERFLWEYKTSLDNLVDFEEESGLDYDKSRRDGQLVFT